MNDSQHSFAMVKRDSWKSVKSISAWWLDKNTHDETGELFVVLFDVLSDIVPCQTGATLSCVRSLKVS